MSRYTKQQQADFDRYTAYGVRQLADMLIDLEKAYDRKSADELPRGAKDLSKVARKALEKKR